LLLAFSTQFQNSGYWKIHWRLCYFWRWALPVFGCSAKTVSPISRSEVLILQWVQMSIWDRDPILDCSKGIFFSGFNRMISPRTATVSWRNFWFRHFAWGWRRRGGEFLKKRSDRTWTRSPDRNSWKVLDSLKNNVTSHWLLQGVCE
jgi:hypothetical protein